MGQQSSRIYIPSIGDHKDIYFNGKYHDKMYIGSQLVWEKISGQSGVTNDIHIGKVLYVAGKYYALISLKGFSYSRAFSTGGETSPIVKGANYFAVGEKTSESTIIFKKLVDVGNKEEFICISYDENNELVSAIGTTKSYIYDINSNSASSIEYEKTISKLEHYTVNGNCVCGNKLMSGTYTVLNYKNGSVEQEGSLNAIGAKFLVNDDTSVNMVFKYVDSENGYTCDLSTYGSGSSSFKLTKINSPTDITQFGFSVANEKLNYLYKYKNNNTNYFSWFSFSPKDGHWPEATTKYNSSFHARLLKGISTSDKETLFLREVDGTYLIGRYSLEDYFNENNLADRVIWYENSSYGTTNTWYDIDRKEFFKVSYEE